MTTKTENNSYLCKKNLQQAASDAIYHPYNMIRFFLTLSLIVIATSSSCKPPKTMTTDSLVNLGLEYYHANRYIEALDVLADAMNRADTEGDDPAYMRALLMIGNTYTLFSDYDQALHYYELCEERAITVKDEAMVNKARNNMLICYVEMGKAQEAEACYKSIGTIYGENTNFNRFYTYHNQALLAKARKDYKLALFMHRQALQYAQDHDMPAYLIAAQMGQMGTISELLNDNQGALDWYLKCKEYAEDGKHFGPLTTACEKLSALYGKLGNEQLEVYYHRRYVSLTDSFFRENEFNSKRSLIAKYEGQHSKRMISSLTTRNHTLTSVIVIIALLLLALSGLLVYIYWQNRRLRNFQRLLIAKHEEHSRQLTMQNELYVTLHQQQVQETEEIQVTPAPTDTIGEDITVTEDNVTEDNAAEDNAADEETMNTDVDLLTKEQADALLMDIAHVMENANVICDPNFSLSQLARMVSSNTKYVSWVINKNYNKNFKSYLTEYRIREASRLLNNTAVSGNLTIAAIAEQVGYKSPTTFNQAFKRIYGMTPSAYMKVAQQKD